jgi:DNA polymerase III alpha subunit
MEKPLLLWVKSAYSFKWGTDLPETLAEAVRLGGFCGAMLADTGGVYGTHRFALAASSAGIKGIAGAELETRAGTIVTGALASGWGQLCRLVTSTRLEERVFPEDAISDSSDLFAVVKDGIQAIRFQSLGWSGMILVPVLPGEKDPDCPAGILPVACAPSMYSTVRSPEIHSMLRKFDELLPRPHVRKTPLDHCRRAFPRFTPDLWRNSPFALMNNLRLSEAVCTLPSPSPYRPPVITEDDASTLQELLLPRLNELYGNSQAAERRLLDELRELSQAGLCGYFLVFHRILSYCEKHRILAVARGSAAGSLVSR